MVQKTTPLPGLRMAKKPWQDRVKTHDTITLQDSYPIPSLYHFGVAIGIEDHQHQGRGCG